MSTETLRYATLSLSGDVRVPVFDRFDRSPDVSVTATRYLGPVEDGQHVGLSDLRGDLDAARGILDDSPHVLAHDVAGASERGIVFAHYRTVGAIGDLLAILYRNDIVLDWPIAHEKSEGGPAVRFTVIGTHTGIQRAVAEIPDAVGFDVEGIGRFASRDDAASLLTESQADLLDLAVDAGYYEVPRETTQRELAAELGVSVGTVSDRLQRVERRVMSDYATRDR